MSVQQLLREIREQGYDGSQNLLYRYLNQQRHLDDQPHLSPRRATRLLVTRPDRLTERQAATVEKLTASCPEMRVLADLVRDFAALLAPTSATKPGSRNGPSSSKHQTCRTCTRSSAASNRTTTPSSPVSPSTSTTAEPKA